MKSVDEIGFDCEVAGNFFGLGLIRASDGKQLWFERSPRADFDPEVVRRIFKRRRMIGFNSINYDLPIIYYALSGASNRDIQRLSDRIIEGGAKPWEVTSEFDFHIPDIDHIDLFEPNPSVKDGLKMLAGRLHVKRMQDLPFEPGADLTFEEMDAAKDYCLNGDIVATLALRARISEALDLRVAMGKQYGGADFRSKSDAQMGEAIIKSEVEKVLGRRVKKANVRAGTSFYFEPPEWMEFETEQLRDVFNTVCNTKLTIDKTGKVVPPKQFEEMNTSFGSSTYSIGIGGIHSTEANRSVKSDDEYVLIDADVASQYPSIIMSRGLYPEALGKDFLPVYKKILDKRLAAKKSGDKVTDKGLKISINGAYGKLGSVYSVLYAPHLLTTVTITGQLSILMLIEKAELAGIPVVSGNTDGVVFKCPRSMFTGFVMKDGKPTDQLAPSKLREITDWWQELTSFKLEFAEYDAIYNQSVNTYIAIKPGGKPKRKGAIANHWNPESPDYDPIRDALRKNPQMTVCADAALAKILHGTPVAHTIMNCSDIREFLTIVKATGGATWREEYLGKVVRYYWSTDGDAIYKVKANASGTNPKVPKTDGCVPMMTLPDDYAVPDDIDYQRYIDEAEQILTDIGFYGDKREPIKFPRVVKANAPGILQAYLVAA